MRKNPENGQNVWGPEEFKDILEKRDAGYSQKEVAAIYGVSQARIYQQQRRAVRYFKDAEHKFGVKSRVSIPDFVYILHVDYDAAYTTHTKLISFTDRDEAEKFRLEGRKRGYKVVHLSAKTAYTAEKAWKMIEEEKKHYSADFEKHFEDYLKPKT